ncbi:uncharacterized protein LOC130825046 isoform X2 [Amaranthus tricolor]|uniref:uncharacterized protein LOC130825046 isoform X2 n=1 Tax=Amaranthus tricolor TaxID=29722 RepID=UPI00258BB8FC|nr:uncharacterized protein LOC130825046 isoform X2 [Amaranthus tricolor]
MARRNGAWVPIIAFLLGLIAVVLSFLAYSKRVKSDDIGQKENGACEYPSSAACVLGIFAAIFLLAEQIIISSGTTCFCCCGSRLSSTCSTIASLILFIISWLTFVIAFLGLIYTAILNNKSYLTKTFSGENGDICEIGKENLFLGAAFWCIITIFLGLISYALWVCGSANGKSYQRTVNSANHGDGIVMGQPHTMQ